MELHPNNLGLQGFRVHEDDSIIPFVHDTLLSAVQKKASDIHFEPYESHYRIRFRIDGILIEETCPPLSWANRISSRIKILSHLDISERRLPQDGRFSLFFNHKHAVDFRVSTCPTFFGEKIVLRILDANLLALDIEHLGFMPCQKMHFLNALNKPQGMILVTGPTGSGKTSTLYAALHRLNIQEVNIVSIEDPIEIKMPGVNQVNIHPKIGLTFSSLMQTFLRQDPDIIMLGEIRSLETAKIASHAAETGHLVLSTLHTNSTAETLTRLVNMGLSPSHIAHSLHLIVAQRLVRKLCLQCRIPAKNNTFSHTLQGCPSCTEGYQGRTGIFEVMPLSPNLLTLISSHAKPHTIMDQAQKEGMLTLYQSAEQLVNNGITSLYEVKRVCGFYET